MAVTAGILIGLGFSPLAASGLSLIANTAPVAFGALGTPVITLAKVHGYDLMEVTAMIGRQLPFFSLLVPFCLHNLIMKVPPVVPKPHPEAAVYVLNLLSATGTGILLAAIVGALFMKCKPVQIITTYFRTFWLVRYSLLTIVLMLALGTLTRYSGTDTTLGLAFANTGVFYPFFGTLMGWSGVAMTGSDTASNVLFGGMQKVAAEQLGLSPNLMGAANSSGGVMGKMIDAQSIVVVSTATRWFDHEGDILRYVFFHSIALACLVGLYVTMQAYVWPFTLMVVGK